MDFENENMDQWPCYHCSGCCWWCNGVGNVFLAHFCPVEPIGLCLNATAYLSIVSDHVQPFIATMYRSSDGYFQQDNALCHKARIISNWFLEHPTNLHQLQDAILLIWAIISKECFQHLVESMTGIIKAVLKAKGGQTQY